MRKNKGTHKGTFITNVFEGWAIYQTENGYRLSSKAPVVGKANYSFAIGPDKKFDRHRGLDAAKLNAERPELYAAVEEYFGGATSPVHPSADDSYGDLAITQKQGLSPQQKWKRALLHMREDSLMARALEQMNAFEAGIRMHHAAIFQFKIDETTLQIALNYVTGGAKTINVQAMLQVLKDYHQGKYKPSSCATLDAQFNLIAGIKENNRDLLG